MLCVVGVDWEKRNKFPRKMFNRGRKYEMTEQVSRRLTNLYEGLLLYHPTGT